MTNRKMTSAVAPTLHFTMKQFALMAVLVMATAATAFAQTHLVLRVDIDNGTTSGDGSDWGTDAIQYLQDALADAHDFVQLDPEINTAEIWVAAGTYRPDQSKVYDQGPNDPPGACPPYGDCDQTKSFELRNNVRILGGFPDDPHLLHNGNGATLLDRDPAQYRTILSGDVRAANVSATAVLDGFVVRGGIELASAQPRFRDCVIQLHEAAAVRCSDASHVMMYRCTFENLDCDSIIVEGQSRLELLLCEPAAVLGGMVGVAGRDSHASPCRRDAWQPRDEAQWARGCGRARVATGSELLVIDQQRWDELVDE